MAAAEMFEEDLSCPICFEDYLLTESRLPKLLLCLHTFCYTCLQHLLQYDGTLQCSICRYVHQVDRVCDLLDNDAVYCQLKLRQEQSDREYARRVMLRADSESESSSDEEPQEPVMPQRLQVPLQPIQAVNEPDDTEESDDEEDSVLAELDSVILESIESARLRGDYMEAIRLSIVHVAEILSDRLRVSESGNEEQQQQEASPQPQVQSSSHQQPQPPSHQQLQPPTLVQPSSHSVQQRHASSHPVQQQQNVSSQPVQPQHATSRSVQHQQPRQQQQPQQQQRQPVQQDHQQNTYEATSETDRDKRKVFVGGLDWNVSWDEVRDFFNDFGPVQDVQLRRGFAFVLFCNADSVERAIGCREFDCRYIEVRKYIPKTLKIFVGDIAGLTIQDLKYYFSAFGVVNEVDSPSRNICFVKFDEEGAVCRAVRFPVHVILDRDVRVQRFNPNLWR